MQELNPERTKVTVAGLKHLTALTHLSSLALNGTQVTDAAVRKLAAALPNCKITWDGATITG